jgi:hypothetical protein
MNTLEADLIAYAANSLPEIIAVPVARWSVEDADENADPLRRLGHLWKALERIDAFVGLLALLEYVRDGNRTSDDPPVQRDEADGAVDRLRGHGLRSWGDWKAIRRDCVWAFAAAPVRMFCPRLGRHTDALKELPQASTPGTEEALAHAVVQAWFALLLAPSDPQQAIALAEDAHHKLGSGRGLQHRPVASYAHVLALRAQYGEEDTRHAREVANLLDRARREVQADYPEIYQSADPQTDAALQTLETGNVIVRAVMRDRGFPPRDQEDASAPGTKARRRRSHKSKHS